MLIYKINFKTWEEVDNPEHLSFVFSFTEDFDFDTFFKALGKYHLSDSVLFEKESLKRCNDEDIDFYINKDEDLVGKADRIEQFRNTLEISLKNKELCFSAKRSCRRVFDVLKTYINPYFFESIRLGDGRLVVGDEVVATFNWKHNTDIPIFKFDQQAQSHRRYMKDDLVREAEYNQYVKQPYIDNDYCLFSVTYVVQEIRRCLSFDEGIASEAYPR